MRPNILWISWDYISPDVGCDGDPHAKTPVLDGLAAGDHEVTTEVGGKNEKATQYFISVKRWLLFPQ